MENENTNRRTLESEFRKGMLRSHMPVGLLMTAFGMGLIIIISGYLLKYFRGAIPLREVYRTEQAGEEYVSFDINYVLDAFMESYRTRSGVRTKSSVYYLVLDEEAGPVPVRVSAKLEAEMDRIMDETWDYLNGVRSQPPVGMHVEGTLKKLKDNGKTYFDRTSRSFDLPVENESYYLWAGMLDNQTPSSAMGVLGLGTVIMFLGFFILFSMLGKDHIKAVQAFLETHENITRQMVDEDFKNSRKIGGTFWLGEDFSYAISGKPVILVNQELKKVLFRIQRVGRGTREELVCVMENGKEYDFTMNKKKAEEAISIYHAKYPALKMSASLKGKLMVAGDGDLEGGDLESGNSGDGNSEDGKNEEA